MFERLNLLLQEDYYKLANISIIIVGLGGVGGYVLESLGRCGFKKIGVVDGDVFEESNLNRQLLATQSSIGKSKVLIAQERIKDICPQTNVEIYNNFLTEEDIENRILTSYDYIIDACDDVKTKIVMIKWAYQNKKTIITCLGTANRLDPTLLEISTLDKTYNDPLARRIRQALPLEMRHTPVVWSKELPLKRQGLGTICHVPMVAGAYLAYYIIEQILGK